MPLRFLVPPAYGSRSQFRAAVLVTPEVDRPEPPKKKLGLQPLAEGPAFGAAPRSLPPVRSFMRMTAAGKSLMAEAILMKPFGKLRTTQTPARTTSRADQRPKQRKGHLNPERVRGRIARRLCRPIPAHTVIFTRSWELCIRQVTDSRNYIWMRPSWTRQPGRRPSCL